MRLIAGMVILFCLGACDKVVKVEEIEVAQTEVRSVGCHRMSYCMTAMPGFDGKMNYGLKLSPMCPGRMDVEVSVTPVLLTYESGKTKLSENVVRLATLSACH